MHQIIIMSDGEYNKLTNKVNEYLATHIHNSDIELKEVRYAIGVSSNNLVTHSVLLHIKYKD